MKNFLKISACCIILVSMLTACGSVPSYNNDSSGPPEPGETTFRDQSKDSVPEPGQTEMN